MLSRISNQAVAEAKTLASAFTAAKDAGANAAPQLEALMNVALFGRVPAGRDEAATRLFWLTRVVVEDARGQPISAWLRESKKAAREATRRARDEAAAAALLRNNRKLRLVA